MNFATSVAIAFLGSLFACSLADDATGNGGVGRFALDENSLQQWKLPKKLKEISGLALSIDDRLFAINDERGTVYELDYRQGKIVKSFTFGTPVVHDDFEGIAYLDGIIYIVTSTGRVYVMAEGNDGDRVDFKIYQTALGKYCEIEGLAEDAETGTLLIACKRNRLASERGELSVYVWSPKTGKFIREREIEVPAAEIAQKLGKKRVSPSAIVLDPDSGNLFGVAGPQRAIFELKPNGELINAIILPLADRHRQPEGIEITRSGKMLIADEGGKKKARLSVYTQGQNKSSDQQE